MTDNFYRAFEEKFRGSRGMIKSRLQVYLPFVKPLLVFLPSAQATDLGCGRGEWLELLAEIGFDAQGVDIDDAMLSACRERGLKVQTGDALAFLRGLPDASQSVVSGFHIAEHLPFETLKELVKEALRVLLPGGLLILETPNPENLVVGTSTFYLDPTHHRPIPPQLLAFLPEYFGFKHIKILRLQESPELAKATEVTFLSVLSGVSPDYAVIAQKEGPDEIFAALQSAFDTEYGLNLETLAHRYQQQAEARATAAEQHAAAAENRATAAEQRTAEAENRAIQAEAASNQHLMQLHAVYASTSWRITAPLRSIGRAVIRLREKATGAAAAPEGGRPVFRRLVASTLNWGVSYAQKSPRFRHLVLRVLNRTPGLSIRLRQMYIQSKLAPNSHQDSWHSSPAPMHATRAITPAGGDAVQPQAKRAPEGINARQRSPLEAYFQNYRGSE